MAVHSVFQRPQPLLARFRSPVSCACRCSSDQRATASQPAIWCQGIISGSFEAEVTAAFPAVGWQPLSLVKVLGYSLPAAAVGALINSQLARLLTSPPDVTAGASQAAGAAAAAAALVHFSQEAVMAILLPSACYFALGNRLVAGRWDAYWGLQTLLTCLLLFPLADPVVYQLWQPAVQVVLGPAPVSPYVLSLQAAAASGDWGSVALNCAASGVLGPIWEEVFWRGFFLTALTKVLPLPACVAVSSLNFALLHLSPHNFLPLLLLSSCCDCLYLRSGGNILAPLLLHGLWNSSQVLQIALLGKDTFV